MFGARKSRTLLVCALLVVVAGCTGFLGGDITEQELLDEIEEADPPEEWKATVEINSTIDEEEIQFTYDIWYNIGGQMRTEGVLDGERIIEVNDGDSVYSYEPEEDQVRVRDAPDGESPLAEMLSATEEMLRAENVSEIRETEFDGRDAYHVVFDAGEGVEKETDDSGILPPLLPSARITGDASEPDEEPADAESAFGEERVEIWIDAEHMFLLGQEIGGDEPFELRYTDVEVDGDFDDDLFEFEVPEDAAVEEVDTPDFQEFDSVEDAQARAPFEIVEPELDGFEHELDSVYAVTFDDSEELEVGLQYRIEGDSELTATIRNNYTEREPDGESVSIGDATGTYERLGNEVHQITWRIDGFEYNIFADTEIDRETLVDLAESMVTT